MIALPLAANTSGLIAVYSVHTSGAGAVWVGLAYAPDVWSLPDMRSRPDVRAMVEADGKPVLMFHALTDDIEHARQQARALATTMPSAMHAIETTYPAVPGRKVRRSDGIVYASAREAARANGADHANLSKHLARRTGFASVAGYTFEWVA